MSGGVLVDNWTLQNAGELLHRRLSGESTTQLEFATDGQSYRYKSISQDLIALDCLCQLLHHIILADELLVDEDFIESWTEFAPLVLLQQQCIIRPISFRRLEQHWERRREAMEDLLCCCPAIRQAHAQNKAAYAATQQSLDPMLAQLVWGGAGMLARADYFRTSYAPHPLRQRLFDSARVLTAPRAVEQLSSFIEEEALKLYQCADQSGFLAQFRLPPTVVEVLDRAASLDEIVPAALELRSSYADVRRWLRRLQDALDHEDAREILAQRKPLLSVAKYLATLITPDPLGDASIQLGVSWLPRVSLKVGALVTQVQNRFRVRAQIGRLVLTPRGRERFRKLLKLLGEEHTARGAGLEDAFARQLHTSVQ